MSDTCTIQIEIVNVCFVAATQQYVLTPYDDDVIQAAYNSAVHTSC